MVHERARFIATLLALFAMWAASVAVSHADPAPDRPSRLAMLDFQLPGQPLGKALQAYGELTGMAVLVDGALLKGRRSAAVMGSFSAADGLTRLLDGTGLGARYTGEHAFTLVPLARAAQVQARAEKPFVVALQRAVTRRLCQYPELYPGTFRAALQMWFDRGDVLQRVTLLGPTGDREVDEALPGALQGMQLGRAAPALPVTLLLERKESGKSIECEHSQGEAGG
ncbi:STN domain-containing protein [Pseudomonas japonica]|uniref:STN domain-containing protein n=1 Tax=Pseudomonas japonica TaxID=256466 RepID=UPI003A8381A0